MSFSTILGGRGAGISGNSVGSSEMVDWMESICLPKDLSAVASLEMESLHFGAIPGSGSGRRGALAGEFFESCEFGFEGVPGLGEFGGEFERAGLSCGFWASDTILSTRVGTLSILTEMASSSPRISLRSKNTLRMSSSSFRLMGSKTRKRKLSNK